MKRLLLSWLVVFWICFGLGYPNLARSLGSPDSVHYYAMVEQSASAVDGHWRYRVLVPYLAKPFFHVAQGRVGAWKPSHFGLLVVNAAFVACTVLILFHIGKLVVAESLAPLIACLLYLINFDVPNEQLGGMVDSSEAFVLAALAYALLTKRWLLLPVLGVIGGLAKETIVPLAAVFAGTWWIVQWVRGDRTTQLLGWTILMAVCGLATVCVVHSAIEGVTVLPGDILATESDTKDPQGGLRGIVTSHYVLSIFGWLLPLGLPHLSRLPRTWAAAAFATAVAALALGIFNDAGGNVWRPVFDACGPLLCLSAALWLVEFMGAGPQARSAPTAS